MKYHYQFFTSILVLVVFSGCFVPQHPYTALPPGPWRGELKLDPTASNTRSETVSEDTRVKFEEVMQGELPFNFEVKYNNSSDYYIELKNGSERIQLDDIIIGRDKKLAKDTIRIEFPHRKGYIHGIFQENVIQGEWVSYENSAVRIQLAAKNGQNYRFTTLRKTPVMDVSGKWLLKMTDITTGLPEDLVLEFQQKENYLMGVLNGQMWGQMEGTVQANKLYLSRFDGFQMVLIEAKILPDSTMIGTFKTGLDTPKTWEAVRIQ